MAKIAFILDGNTVNKGHLSAFLHADEALPDGELEFDFNNVPEDLALWLLSSVSSLHGLTPVQAPPAPAPAPEPVFVRIASPKAAPVVSAEEQKKLEG